MNPVVLDQSEKDQYKLTFILMDGWMDTCIDT